MNTPKYPSASLSLRLALALTVVCGLSFAGWRVGASKAATESPRMPAASTAFAASAALQAPSGRTDIAGPAGSGEFGRQTVVLPNGNFVVTDPTYDEGGKLDIGAVYLYDGATLAVISTLKGSTNSDQVGSGTIIPLTGGNHFVVVSTNWDNGATANVGAVTLCSATTGCNGTVSAANSLIGATPSDQVGAVTALANGNYVVRSAGWDNTSGTDVGAITWCNAATNSCANQTVAATNSLVGSTSSDIVGNYGITALPNGNFFVRSANWDNGGATDAGAVTFCSGATGCPNGAVSAANSLVGSTASDLIGSATPAILSSGNVVFPNGNWDNGAIANAGAVVFCSGTTGCKGVVSAANALVGTAASDNVSSVTALTNGNYIVRSTGWDNGTATNAGAVTWCSGTTGCTGAVSAANSLVGSTTNDFIGQTTVALVNGNYVVSSSGWDNGTATDVGAVTWCNGTSGCTGTVSAANSLVGTTVSDQVGFGLLALTNGNYVVRNPNWDNNTMADAGAVTWCNGSTASGGCAPGAVTTTNSLTGGAAGNLVGLGAGIALAGGNYVVSSSGWDNGATTDAGAATLCNGTTNNCAGQIVAPSNSLIGGGAGNSVGGAMTAFPNGNYVVRSTGWDNGAVTNVGAITFCNAATNSCAGQTVSATNSLVGSTANDQIGNAVVTLTNGNLVLRSGAWDNAAVSPVAISAGAITFCHRTAGCPVGVLSAANSLVGTRSSDGVGIVRSLTGGNYVVQTTGWDNFSPSVTNVGAVTWCNGTTGCAGTVSTANSIIGSTASDSVGVAAALSNGNYTIFASAWDKPAPGAIGNARFALYGNGATGTFGLPTDAANADRTVIGTVGSGITAAPRFDVVNNQMIVQRSLSNRVTVLRFLTTTTTATASGDWENPTTWSNGVPNLTNHPIIPNGRTVTLNAATTVTNLTVQAGGNLVFNADLTVANALNLGAVVSTGSKVLTLGCEATVTGAGPTAFVNGNLKKDFCDLGTFGYPVGTTTGGNQYSPVTATVTEGTFDPTDSLTVRAVKGNRAGLIAGQSAQRYFVLTEEGDTTASLTFNYVDADVNGTEADYKLYRFTGPTSTLIPATLNAATNQTTAEGVTDFGEFAIGTVPLVNTAPTIAASTGLARQSSSFATSSVIATVTDAESGAGGVEVNVASANPSNGVTVSNIVNNDGTITADIFAACGAANASFTLQVSDGVSTVNATLDVAVTANTAPALTYGNPSALVNNGSTTVAPTLANDNGPLVFSVQPGHGFTTPPTVAANGVVSISSAQPAGLHTVTIRATDACGLFADASFNLTVNPNTAPTITTAAFSPLTRQKGAAATSSTIATAADLESNAAALTVTLTSANPSNGVTLSGLANDNGTVTANVAADCTATNASFTLQVSDGALTATATLNVTVTASATASAVINPASLPGGSRLTTFNQTLSVSGGGAGPFNYSLANGALPAGMTLSSAGVLGGSPTVAGTFNFTVQATSTNGCPVTKAYTLTVASGAAGLLLVNEYRFSGPGGAGDWYVELYNAQATAISTTGIVLGFTNATGNLVESLPLTPNVTIPPRGFYLVAGSQYSLTTVTAPDQTVAAFTTINSLGGVGVFGGSVSPSTKFDSVGVTGLANSANAFFVEGTALASPGASALNYAFVRSFSLSSGPLDTNNNAANFILVEPTGAVINGVTARIGAASPDGATSPPFSTGGKTIVDLLDVAVAQTVAPNRVRITTPETNAALGTMLVRRSFTNNSGGPINILRFSVYDITNNPADPTNIAIISLLNSSGGTASTSTGEKTIKGATLRTPISGPGGLNSTYEIALPTPLAHGQTVNVEFKLGVQRGGTFRFNFIVEAK